MRVAKLVEVGKIEVFEQEAPEPGRREALVKMQSVGICGSDVHYFLEGGLGSYKSKLPLDIGHEPAGVVVEANGCNGFRPGDRVAIEPGRACGECEFCHRGLHNLCQGGAFMGANGEPGAFQEYVVVHQSQMARLDDWMTADQGALLEPFGVAYHSVRLASLHVGAKVAIFGAGPIGLSILLAAKMAGAGETFLVDKMPPRLKHAKAAYDVEHAVCESEHDSVDYIKTVTKGRGVDVAFDAAGAQRTVDACFMSASRAGKIVLVGIPSYDLLTYNPHSARTKELTIINVRRSNQTLHRSLELLSARKMDLGGMVTHRFGLEQIQSAFELVAGYRDGVVKTVIHMDGVR
jgi:L-iditol 2-dehydrogenase